MWIKFITGQNLYCSGGCQDIIALPQRSHGALPTDEVGGWEGGRTVYKGGENINLVLEVEIKILQFNRLLWNIFSIKVHMM